ncbi:hypothetical protein CTAYLR_004068 [Chrysophaeum taylorii]|uniref:SAP domain-containing protein n=1 Tax=Chrysophaeum taylorii TaxID=2483200 RepID=A0AAD7XTY9_9STRA|nr:hypothetical protein CTAYLR_004068 [Chrysophaeum taylorii]
MAEVEVHEEEEEEEEVTSERTVFLIDGSASMFEAVGGDDDEDSDTEAALVLRSSSTRFEAAMMYVLRYVRARIRLGKAAKAGVVVYGDGESKRAIAAVELGPCGPRAAKELLGALGDGVFRKPSDVSSWLDADRAVQHPHALRSALWAAINMHEAQADHRASTKRVVAVTSSLTPCEGNEAEVLFTFGRDCADRGIELNVALFDSHRELRTDRLASFWRPMLEKHAAALKSSGAVEWVELVSNAAEFVRGSVGESAPLRKSRSKKYRLVVWGEEDDEDGLACYVGLAKHLRPRGKPMPKKFHNEENKEVTMVSKRYCAVVGRLLPPHLMRKYVGAGLDGRAYVEDDEREACANLELGEDRIALIGFVEDDPTLDGWLFRDMPKLALPFDAADGDVVGALCGAMLRRRKLALAWRIEIKREPCLVMLQALDRGGLLVVDLPFLGEVRRGALDATDLQPPRSDDLDEAARALVDHLAPPDVVAFARHLANPYLAKFDAYVESLALDLPTTALCDRAKRLSADQFPKQTPALDALELVFLDALDALAPKPADTKPKNKRAASARPPDRDTVPNDLIENIGQEQEDVAAWRDTMMAYTRNALADVCRDRGLAVSGTKPVLVDRIEQYVFHHHEDD